ncbi:MAG: B12-binding domain-containing radical SAM protein [Bacteroidetes bacterium]|nr:B12-binding domain-containing radical SAM protein [Bacteroidota bacterium]
MKKTVVLYNPYAVFYTMPLALIAVGSYLNPDKYNIEIIDARLEKNPLEKIKTALSNNGICFATTVLTGAPIKDAQKISREVKKLFPKIPVVWGGWHPSLFPEQTLHDDAIDIVVKGQGEITFKELLERLETHSSLEGLQGISFKNQENKVISNDERVMLDINQFPAFNYELIDVPSYMKLSGRKQIDYISSQGCRFRCSFCADPFMYKRGWYGFSAERMVNEIEELWKKYKFEHVHFQDETFFTNSKRVKAIAEEFIKRKLPITWFGTMRADQGVRLEDDVWELCKKSGLEKVMIGMEAGSQEMLNWMQKDIKLEQVFDSATKCIKYDIGINFSIIIGFPGEKEESMNATMNMVKELRKMSSKFNMGIFYFKPYPGNKIADELLAKGFNFATTLEEWSNFDYVSTPKSEWIRDEKIKEIENFKFYQQLAYTKRKIPVLKNIARWRINNNIYTFPLEKKLKEWIMPTPKMA